MIRSIAAAATAALILAAGSPALADDHNHRDNHQARGNQHGHYVQPFHRAPVRRYHEGQVYNGHRLTYRGGHWGYYQPHNGVQLFVNIPI